MRKLMWSRVPLMVFEAYQMGFKLHNNTGIARWQILSNLRHLKHERSPQKDQRQVCLHSRVIQQCQYLTHHQQPNLELYFLFFLHFMSRIWVCFPCCIFGQLRWYRHQRKHFWGNVFHFVCFHQNSPSIGRNRLRGTFHDHVSLEYPA